MIESLEGRRHLSVSVSKGVLAITGTSGVDSISITRNGSSVITKVNSRTQSLPLKSVVRADVSALAGNDIIAIASSFTKPTAVNGGNGDDWLGGGGGNDNLVGGSGNDFIAGQGGSDKVSGGLGDDNLQGNGGNDTVDGGTGNDDLSGGPGNDSLDGGGGVDGSHSSNGNDVKKNFEFSDPDPVDETFIDYDFDENWVLTRYDLAAGQIPPSWTRLPPVTIDGSTGKRETVDPVADILDKR